MTADNISKQIYLSSTPSNLSTCVFDKAANEPWALMTYQAPVSTVLPRGDGFELISSVQNNVWLWALVLEVRSSGTNALIEARSGKAISPYLSRLYFLEKVERFLGECEALNKGAAKYMPNVYG